ncbi:MAG: hypothetical protein MSA16_02125 [Treponema porcinum]|nr:hypothetical protein [Treponema porcinum]MCI6481104.1 hypothetical protein [Treponema porcinum]
MEETSDAVFVFQMRMFPSDETDARSESSELKERLVTGVLWPSSGRATVSFV